MTKQRTDDFNSKFFKHIDSPMMILVFEADDLVVGFAVLWVLIAGSFVAGLKAGGIIFIYLLAAGLVSFGYSKYKKDKPSGYIFQFLYKKGFYHPLSVLVKSKKYNSKYKVAQKYFTTTMKGQ